MDFKPRHQQQENNHKAVSVEGAIYRRLVKISTERNTTLKEVASRLLELGLEAYEKLEDTQ